MRATAAFTVVIVLLVLATMPQAQGTAPATPLTLISRDGRRTVPTVIVNGQELISLDEVASLFQVTVREDTLAGGITVSYRGRTIVTSANQPMVSVNGRVVTLPAPATRSGRTWLVPVEFLSRALAPIYDQPLDLRRASRLLLVGDVRVPRVAARVETAGPPTRATVDVTPAVPVSIVSVDNSRIVLRIDADAMDLALPPGGGGLIEQIRSGDQPNTVAVVLGPGAGPPRAVATPVENSTRVAIEIPSAAPVSADATPSRGTPAPAPEIPDLTTPRPQIESVVIDPGHGGDDPGARGPGGTEEKALTLDVARRLRSLLETRLGLHVIMTREDDRTVGLDERAAIANNSKADLFLSLHANTAPSASVAGAEVFYLRLDREGEDVRREAAAEAIQIPVLGGGSRTIDVIRWDLAQARHVDASSTLASMLEQDLGRRVTMSPMPLRQAPLRVLIGANMPAAVVEMAYLSNPGQEKLARSDGYKNSLAQAMFDAILRFRVSVEEERPR